MHVALLFWSPVDCTVQICRKKYPPHARVCFVYRMRYGPGASAKIWVEMFKNVSFIELDKTCVDKHKEDIKKGGYQVFVGSQTDILFLEKTANLFGYFDIIIDDGGHANYQMMTSLAILWNYVLSGGIYDQFSFFCFAEEN